jgi:prolyl-tRNA synthetase
VRFSQALIRTSKETPTDAAGVSHVLLTRAGYVRRLGAGIYNFLPLGLRVLRKIEGIVRAELDRSGAQEVLMPALLPAEYFQETGRYTSFGDALFRLKDRKGAEYNLGPTHEEIITDMVRRDVKSYRELPLNLYQIQGKFRDEARPRAGLLRGREFIMKDAYSFDVDEAGALKSYEKMRDAYHRIFRRLGLDFRMVSADSGAMGGSTSAEFQVLVQSGEDFLAVSDGSDYAANLEVATCLDPRIAAAAASAAAATSAAATSEGGATSGGGKEAGEGVTAEGAAAPAEKKPVEKVHTPGKGSIADVASFLKASKKRFLKSLVYVAPGAEGSKPALILAVVRGDHEVNEIKLARAVGATEVHLASEADVRSATGAGVGYAGPVGFAGRILVDRDASLVGDGIAGANESDHHLIHVVFGRDYQGEVADLRSVVDGDLSPDGKGKLKVYRGIEAGHIFILGTHYSAKMGANYIGEDGASHPIVMGCYGIGISRLVATTIEQNHDDDGIVWPMAIAPFQVELVTLGQNAELNEAAGKLVADLESRGVEVLWDDRDERPGVKFKDADLLGIPIRLTLGDKGLKAGSLELKARTEKNPKAFEAIPLEGAAELVATRVREALQR